MGRPKRPYNGVEDIAWSDDPWLLQQGPGPVTRREKERWDAATRWHYPTVNGLYDPLTYMHILDVVINIDPDIELRTKNLVAFLTKERPEFYWDGITVGKVLANIYEAFEDMLGKKNGILERGADYKGAFYRIHHNNETARLAVALQRDLYKMAEVEKVLRQRGERGAAFNPLIECASVRVPFPEENAV